MDGSQKLPQRLLGTIWERHTLGLPVRRAALGVAAWMRYVIGVDERGKKIDVRDPLASRLEGVSKSSEGRPDRLVDGLSLRSLARICLATNASGRSLSAI